MTLFAEFVTENRETDSAISGDLWEGGKYKGRVLIAGDSITRYTDLRVFLGGVHHGLFTWDTHSERLNKGYQDCKFAVWSKLVWGSFNVVPTSTAFRFANLRRQRRPLDVVWIQTRLLNIPLTSLWIQLKDRTTFSGLQLASNWSPIWAVSKETSVRPRTAFLKLSDLNPTNKLDPKAEFGPTVKRNIFDSLQLELTLTKVQIQC